MGLIQIVKCDMCYMEHYNTYAENVTKGECRAQCCEEYCVDCRETLQACKRCDEDVCSNCITDEGYCDWCQDEVNGEREEEYQDNLDFESEDNEDD